MTATPRAADVPYTWRCGCCPGLRVICTSHCQWQGCTRDQHTNACVAGERIPEGAAVLRVGDGSEEG